MKYLKNMSLDLKIILLISIMLLSACQSVKDGLSLKKRDNPDEFLVEKKNPLVLPPDYNELPIPDNQNTSKPIKQENEIQSLISQNNEIESQSEAEITSSDIEKSILDKINKR
jgi:hypothetical protein